MRICIPGPKIHYRLAIVRYRDRGTDLNPAFEVGHERITHRLKPVLTEPIQFHTQSS